MNIKKIAVFTGTGFAAASIALTAPGIASADFAEPGVVSSGVAELTGAVSGAAGRANTSTRVGEVRIAEFNVVGGQVADVRVSDKAEVTNPASPWNPEKHCTAAIGVGLDAPFC